MKFTQRTRGILQAIAVVLSVAVPVMFAISAADARPGGGGSRGSRTFSAPPPTATAPNAAQPLNRTITQPGSPGMAGPAAAGAAAKGGFFNKPGMGMLGGLAAGFLGAGLLGMLFGGGLFSGLGGLSSIIGLILQIGLIFIVVKLAMSWWQRRHAPAAASAYAGPAPGAAVGPGGPLNSLRTGTGFGLGSGSAPLEIQPADYEAFERLLGDVQTAWSNEAEAWREGETDYASVAMRFSLVDKTLERGTDRLVAGSEQPIEATEVWTFVRRRGENWELSAIQQA
jgi:predicted lipid-binding transport protein (Tim44 family)